RLMSNEVRSAGGVDYTIKRGAAVNQRQLVGDMLAGEIARHSKIERALTVGDCAGEGDLAAGNRQGVAVAVVGNGCEDLAACAEGLIELAGAGVAGDREVKGGIVAAAPAQDDFVITLHGQRVTDVIGAREIGRGDSAGAETLVKRAVRVITRHSEIVVLGGGGIAAQNDPAITEKADAKGECFAAADRRLGHSSVAKRGVERAVRVVAGEHESTAAAGVVGAA